MCNTYFISLPLIPLSLKILRKGGDRYVIRQAHSSNAGKGTGATSEILEGLNKPVRPVNFEFPPNQTVADALVSDRFKNLAKCSGMDCSEIAEKLLDVAGGKGKIIEVRPKNKGQLNVFENGRIEPGQYYHQVYTMVSTFMTLVCHRNQYQKVIGRNILK